MSLLLLIQPTPLLGAETYRRITVDGAHRESVDGAKRIHERLENELVVFEENDTIDIQAAVAALITIDVQEADDITDIDGSALLNKTVTPASIDLDLGMDTPVVGWEVSPSIIDLDLGMDTPSVSTGGASTVSVATIDLDLAIDGSAAALATDGSSSSSLVIDISIDIGLTSLPASATRVRADGQPLPYRVILMKPGGIEPISSLENAAVGDMSWDLNGVGSMSFTMPIFDEKIADLRTAEREVQVWYGPDLLWWGVIVRAQVKGSEVVFQCQDLGWYFTRRVIGTAETNYIQNGDFEQGADYWLLNQYAPSEPLDNRNPAYHTSEIRDTRSISGRKALYMESGTELQWGTQTRQFFEWTPNPSEDPEGEEWSVVAWAYIPSATYQGPRVREYDWDRNLAALGLILQRISTTETEVKSIYGVGTIVVPKLIESVVVPITDDTPKDTWIRFEAPLTQDITGEAEFINVLLCTPIGGVYWDAISLVRNEKLYWKETDQATIIQGIVEHAQDVTLDKSDLNIGTSCPATGVKRDRTYYYFNHELISDCVDEFPQLFDGMDWNIEITPTQRTFTTHYPQRGTLKPKYVMVLGKNISRATVSVDGEQTSNKVMVLADGGSGAAREEAISLDDTALDEGLVLEKVYNATPGSTINTLQAQANRGVARYKNPVVLPDITTYPTEVDNLLGMIVPGDIIPVNVSRGWISLVGLYRVITITLNPKTGELTYTLNPYANWDVENFQ